MRIPYFLGKVQIKPDGAMFEITGIEGCSRDGMTRIKVGNTWYDKKDFENIYIIIK